MQWCEGDQKPLVKEIALAGVCWSMATHVSVGSLLWGACGRTEHVKLRVKWKAPVKPAWDLSIVDLFISQPGLVLGIASPQVQHLALGFVECHELRTAQLFRIVPVPLDDILVLKLVSCTL